jgi:uncharacterized protein YjbI with pentapeptide repeats
MTYRDRLCAHCEAAIGEGDVVVCPRCSKVSSSVGELRQVDLRGRALAGADLSGLDLTGAMLARADLRRIRAAGAKLDDAILTFADLTDADLSGASLDRADLRGANLHQVSLDGASLHRAKVDIVYAILRGFDGVPDWRPLGELGPADPRPSRRSSERGLYTSAGGERIRCPLCGGEAFEVAGAALRSPGSYSLVCGRCSHIVSFAREPLLG